MAAGAPKKFVPGGYRGARGPPTADQWNEFTDAEKDKRRGEEWMKRAYGWDVNARVDDKSPEFRWIGERTLGKGVGVFKRRTSRADYKRVVVKQVYGAEAKRLLKKDSDFLKTFHAITKGAWIDHIVKPVRYYAEDAGTGTDDTFDPVYVHEFAPETVARLYTEYCEEGNFDQWLENNYFSEYPSENDIWSTMDCLAKICMMLEHGDSRRSVRWGEDYFKSIVHLDIRPESIFCTKDIKQPDGQHSNLTKFMLGKFAKAEVIPLDYTDPKWMWYVRGRAAPEWATPEQKYPDMERRRIAAPCNIFGIGALIYYMIKREPVGDRAWNLAISNVPKDQKFGLYFGGDLITEPISTQQKYSKTLIRTVLQCLAYHPENRIDAYDLQKRTAAALAVTGLKNLPGGTLYNPGDPATAFEPKEKIQPNDHDTFQLNIQSKSCDPTSGIRQTIRARAETWLSNFWLFPDSKKSQQARDSQRLEYERQAEKERLDKAEEAKRKALADLEAKHAQKLEDAKKGYEKMLAAIEAQKVQDAAAIAAQLDPQALLPPPPTKRGRSPSPVDQKKRQRVTFSLPGEENIPKTPVVQDKSSQPIDVDSHKDNTAVQLKGKDKEKDTAADVSVSRPTSEVIPGTVAAPTSGIVPSSIPAISSGIIPGAIAAPISEIIPLIQPISSGIASGTIAARVSGITTSSIPPVSSGVASGTLAAAITGPALSPTTSTIVRTVPAALAAPVSEPPTISGTKVIQPDPEVARRRQRQQLEAENAKAEAKRREEKWRVIDEKAARARKLRQEKEEAELRQKRAREEAELQENIEYLRKRERARGGMISDEAKKTKNETRRLIAPSMGGAARALSSGISSNDTQPSAISEYDIYDKSELRRQWNEQIVDLEPLPNISDDSDDDIRAVAAAKPATRSHTSRLKSPSSSPEVISSGPIQRPAAAPARRQALRERLRAPPELKAKPKPKLKGKGKGKAELKGELKVHSEFCPLCGQGYSQSNACAKHIENRHSTFSGVRPIYHKPTPVEVQEEVDNWVRRQARGY
ncbi:hypothetical protein SBOR_7536 [Sclerotinia borealis F-4128]|uniref:Protein kinase domain-containing protein n=1 Tax=Sclerotinia borealis (strain F-4128) TaxID=1432307 RepID=W9CB44_SCLBF|nr:hypothetical protein SBOR_7536 [Sclerotinia borealis F-4128]